MANKAYKFRIYPDDVQKVLFARTFGCVRMVYNHWLARKIRQYEEDKTAVTYTVCAKEMAEMKKTEAYAFLREVDSVALQHRAVPKEYKLKSVTVSQTPGGKYYASILFEYENQVQEKEMQSFLGLDFSMHELYRDSNGNEPAYPKYYRNVEEKLVREQRRLSKMQKGSNNRSKQRIKVAKLHEKVSSQRKDFLHKLSRQLANAYDCVCIESLDMKAMSQMLNFGKSVSDNGWGMFTGFLKYKLEEQGKKLVKVDKFFASSQICSVCGYRNAETRKLAVREWDCPQCGTHHDRDVNAAVNIRNEGMRLVVA